MNRWSRVVRGVDGRWETVGECERGEIQREMARDRSIARGGQEGEQEVISV